MIPQDNMELMGSEVFGFEDSFRITHQPKDIKKGQIQEKHLGVDF